MISNARCIAHLDMDSFFVSVVRLRFPFLNKVPLVVGGKNATLPSKENHFACDSLLNYEGRGVIASASYEARALSLKSGMALKTAAEILKKQHQNAALLPVLMNDNRFYSHQFKSVVRAIAPQIEEAGMDEIYIDLSAFQNPVESAQNIQKAVWEKTGLSCSIGLAPNKLMAKLASAFEKPKGLTQFFIPQDLEKRIWILPVLKINGIGQKTAEKLKKLNIFTIGDLAKAPLENLVKTFGVRQGNWLKSAAWGEDFRELKLEKAVPLSLSAENTFTRDYALPQDRALLTQNLNALCLKLSFDLKRKKMCAKTVAVKIVFGDFSTQTRGFSLKSPIVEADDLCQAARQNLKYFNFQKPLRLLGVSAKQLLPLKMLKEEKEAWLV